MTDYKSLFLKSQAEIADSIELLEILRSKPIQCMQYCDDEIIENDDTEEIKE